MAYAFRCRTRLQRFGKQWVVAAKLFHSASPEVDLDRNSSTQDEIPEQRPESAMVGCEPTVASNQSPKVCSVGNVAKGCSNGFCSASLDVQLVGEGLTGRASKKVMAPTSSLAFPTRSSCTVHAYAVLDLSLDAGLHDID